MVDQNELSRIPTRPTLAEASLSCSPRRRASDRAAAKTAMQDYLAHRDDIIARAQRYRAAQAETRIRSRLIGAAAIILSLVMYTAGLALPGLLAAAR